VATPPRAGVAPPSAGGAPPWVEGRTAVRRGSRRRRRVLTCARVEDEMEKKIR
jgi:hypothetical protein